METVAIFGVGLIGGSFALALKKAGFRGRIAGVSSPGTIRAAIETGAIDEGLSFEEAASTADLIYLAHSISRILETLPRLDRYVRPDALITDAGSTKFAIVRRAAETLHRGRFLGGHPLAGKELRGVENADADLFRGKTYVLTPYKEDEIRSPNAASFLDWLERIGARVHVTSAQFHDSVIAYTSHLPQLTSTALGACLESRFGADVPPIWGPALVDSTRLALSSFDIWGDILRTNRDEVDAALAAFIQHLQMMRLALPETGHDFETAAKLAGSIRDSS